ncbi:uncharacterized protein AMSG_10014 [Thecamonas trahens ATCC 50062]|uniref:Thioredoxin-like fold domain-containing protein n=1 Tax=Thecamonas trahens ATCC 50062 TaxID=461836 RepID=A0A0L0DPK0_THETB|nr:hypothetical protein AMSG_10014 [Thecamonas trahens ATCC 50062]KNC54222.1 hypothetical protein AMSG_10014 [Thecamonas trahens ATCC 50062]|eukprot:XP_013753860.1 hypothetical protein AMSG_10014 [Thecamonas trahens ATCC 50062]
MATQSYLYLLLLLCLYTTTNQCHASPVSGFSQGPSDGILVEVYLDYSCPESRVLYNRLKTMDDVHVVGYPLPMPQFQHSWRLATASLDAAMSGEGDADSLWWSYSEKVFSKQSELVETTSDDAFFDKLKDVTGVDSKEALKGHDANMEARWKAIVADGIYDVPALFVNGNRVTATPDDLATAVRTASAPANLKSTSKAVAIVPLFLITVLCVVGGVGSVKVLMPMLTGGPASGFPAMAISGAPAPPTRFVDDSDEDLEADRFGAGLAPVFGSDDEL